MTTFRSARVFGSRTCARLVAGLAAATVCALPALAQQAAATAQSLKTPTPGKPEDPGLVGQIFLAAAGVLLVGGLFLIKAKRGHQD
jgi:hypothetical protein